MRHSTGQKYSDVSVEVKVDGGKGFCRGMEGVNSILGDEKKKQRGMERSVDIPIVFCIRMEHGWCSRNETRKVSKERENEVDPFGGR
jgi:hypothetical protein